MDILFGGTTEGRMLAAEYLARGETPLVDLAPLCIDRFGMNPPSLPSA